jgi:tRNA G26 N,N-dimethylase Trm1
MGTNIAGTTVKGIVEALPKLGFEAQTTHIDKNTFSNHLASKFMGQPTLITTNCPHS